MRSVLDIVRTDVFTYQMVKPVNKRRKKLYADASIQIPIFFCGF